MLEFSKGWVPPPQHSGPPSTPCTHGSQGVRVCHRGQARRWTGTHNCAIQNSGDGGWKLPVLLSYRPACRPSACWAAGGRNCEGILALAGRLSLPLSLSLPGARRRPADCHNNTAGPLCHTRDLCLSPFLALPRLFKYR